MSSLRQSNLLRRVAWMAMVVAVFVFVLVPAGWAEVHISDGRDGQDGDPGDGHDSAGGGGSLLGESGSQNEVVAPVKPQRYDHFSFIPIFTFDSGRITITFLRVDEFRFGYRVEGGAK